MVSLKDFNKVGRSLLINTDKPLSLKIVFENAVQLAFKGGFKANRISAGKGIVINTP